MPNLTRVSRGSICLSSLHHHPSLFLSPRCSVVPSSPLSLSLSFQSTLHIPLPSACEGFAHIYNARKISCRGASPGFQSFDNTLFACASAHTGVHNAPHTRGRVCARRSGSSVCATIFKSARESTRCCPSRSPSSHPRVQHPLSHRPPTSARPFASTL